MTRMIPNGMSKEAYYFIGGLMKHIKADIYHEPIVNSYKRFVPGFEAPVHIAWSRKNRTPLIPNSADRGGTSESNFVVRILQQTLIWHWQYVWQQDWTVSVVRSPPDSIDRNLFEMSEEELKRGRSRKASNESDGSVSGI